MTDALGSAGGSAERVGVIVIHGVGETQPGWVNTFLVPELQARDKNLTFEPHSEVHELPDTSRRRPNAKFTTYLRRGRVAGGPEVALIEFFWNDLARVGTNAITGFITMIRLFYEAPQVLGKSALLHSNQGLPFILKTLILFANWLLRWPITGIVTAAFLCGLAALGLLKLKEAEWLTDAQLEVFVPYVLGAVLAILPLPAIWFGRNQQNRDIALSDAAYSTAYCSIFLLALLAIAESFNLADSFDAYLIAIVQMVLLLWLAWNHAVILAFLLWLFLLITRPVMRQGSRAVAIIRPAAALALTMIQGVIWKIVVGVPWLFLFNALSPVSFEAEQCTGAEIIAATCDLQQFEKNLINVVLFNISLVLVLALGFLAVALWRVIVRRAKRDAQTLPRLIVSPIIITLIFALTLFNHYSFYAEIYRGWFQYLTGIQFSLPFNPYAWAERRLGSLEEFRWFVTYLGGATAAIFLVFRLFRAAQNASRGLLHIGRDLVDHQYSPELASSRLIRAYSPGGDIPNPRRNRIETRLDMLMQQIVGQQKYDRLVFVAHSQGTVILYDYLFSGRDETSIQGVNRIDIVTLASPLSHIYRHYFDHYDKMIGPRSLNEKLASWTNFWRIDDPIGHRVDNLENDFIKNESLRHGGHINYWKDERVCETLLKLIDPRWSGAPAKEAAAP